MAGAVVLVAAGALRLAGAPLLVALLTLPVGALAVALWRRRGYPQHRSRLEIVGGSRWPWHWEAWRWRQEATRDLRPTMEVWDFVASQIGVPGAKLQRVVADPAVGYSLHLELKRGQIALVIHLPRLHSALRLNGNFTPATPDPRRPWQVVIEEIPEAEPDELHDDAPAVSVAPPPVAMPPLVAQRAAALHRVVDRLDAEIVSAAELGKRAWPAIPRQWMSENITGLAGELHLRRVKGGWQRLAVEEEAS